MTVKAERIRITANTVGNRTYLYLELSYGYTENGKYKKFRQASGHSIDPQHWHEGDFTYSYVNGQRKEWKEITSDLDVQKEKIVRTLNSFIADYGYKPSPADLKQAMKADKSSSTAGEVIRTPMAQWIRENIHKVKKVKKSKQTIDRKTQMKMLAVAGVLEAMEQARKLLPEYATQCEGKSKILYFETFSEADWNDYSLLIDMAGDEIGKYTKDIIKLPIAGTKDAEDRTIKPAYALTTKHKLQVNLMQLMQAAKKLKVDFELKKFEKVGVGQSSRLFYLEPNEIADVIEGSGRIPSLENVRKLLLLHIFTGSRIKDVGEILSAPLEYINGVPTIQYSSDKTNTIIVLPLFEPVLGFWLKPETKPHVIAGPVFNRMVKVVADELGLHRKILVQLELATGEMIKPTPRIPLNDLISSHIGRKTIYSLLIGHLRINDTMVTTAVTGHTNRNEAHKAYYALNERQTAEQLYKQVFDLQDRLPFIMATEIPEPPIESRRRLMRVA